MNAPATPASTAAPQLWQSLRGRSFSQLPAEMIIRSFEVDYVRLDLGEAGEIYLTRFGWPFLRQLMPSSWFVDRYYLHHGQRLTGSTGAVYRVPTAPDAGPSIDLVVKFSRVGQEVPLEVATTFPQGVCGEDIANARFNSPFEEFGLMMEMRRGVFGPHNISFLSHRPMAIYVPSEKFDLWQLGRSQGRFLPHQLELREDQEHVDTPQAIELDIKRDYVLVYSWIKGENAEDYFTQQVLPPAELEALSARVNAEMAAKGFRVLDNKPKHFILRRRRRDGSLVRRNGELTYALIDFELLQRTEQHQQAYKSIRRAAYWTMQSAEEPVEMQTLPAQLSPMHIMGVDYIYGSAPNGGRLWVVGSAPELFDYFLPDRWRRSPRLKLSSINEVYRTRTRDNIHVVYRQCRVGEKPHVEPAHELGRQILAYGYNSPFEEASVAQAIRRAGLPTAYLRAIYCTGHHSQIARSMADPRRYQTHADLRLPDDPDESVLSSNHDYYTLWGLWRGLDPMQQRTAGGRRGVIDVQQAFDEGLLTHDQFEHLLYLARHRLAAIGLQDETLDETYLLLSFDADGRSFSRDASGELVLTFSMDAQRALESGLLTDSAYLDLIEQQRCRLFAAGFESLALHGDHLLLSADLDGALQHDEHGNLLVTQCNFTLIRTIDGGSTDTRGETPSRHRTFPEPWL